MRPSSHIATQDGNISTLHKVPKMLVGRLGAVLLFLIGVITGPVIQQKVFAFLPGPKVDASLRVERVTVPGELGCNYYLFTFRNLATIDYMYAKLQLPNPVTSSNIGSFSETVQDNDDRTGNLLWEKGWDSHGKCVVSSNSLTTNQDIQSTASGTMIKIQSTSKLPIGTPIVGMIATTDDLQSTAHPKLWTEGAYEFSEFGQTIRKNLGIQIHVISK